MRMASSGPREMRAPWWSSRPSIEPAPEFQRADASKSTAAAESDSPRESSVGEERGESIQPLWSDYCSWFVFLLPASLTELLVFVGVGFCLTESGLQRGGFRPLPATVLAAVFASVTFGLFHFTHPPPWPSYAFYPLMPIMLVIVGLFVVTRNFTLTLLLHNSFAAADFTTVQYSRSPPSWMKNPAIYLDASILFPILVSFVVPFLLLHWLEARKLRVES